ncbi:MAG: tetratricopeptide repeat protein [Verrucomicrobia bacterium]|nr:tetratricopeptide repeat protein [Verrucomicrobiota bacterium]
MNWKELLFGSRQSDADRELTADLRVKAEDGDLHAQNELGRAYFLGLFGLAKDEVESAKWFRMAAEQNDAVAQYNLGWRYADGRGVPMDKAEAVKWYRKAAEQGHPDAQAHLGYCYYMGTGVEKDWAEAYKWEDLARAQGKHGLSKTVIAKLEKMLSADQLAKGKQLSSEFKTAVIAKEQRAP